MKFWTSFLSFSSSSSFSKHRPSTTTILRDMNAVTIQPDGTSRSMSDTPSSSSSSSTTNTTTTPLQKVITTALWSYFAGDAMSAPTHWFYGGTAQIQQYYGRQGITTYTKPSYTLSGSILNKSNMNGGGRSTTTIRSSTNQASSSSSSSTTTIIGNVINHGKQDLWDPKKSIHYHATLEAGENTLEVSIARVLMKSIVQNHGQFHVDHFRQAYMAFMMTPNSHNDTYASTCHRMYFANYYYQHLDPIDCPDNDQHNVDTIDGLVLPTITAMAVAGQPYGTVQQAMDQAVATVSVTRNSPTLQRYARAWAALVFHTVRTAASVMTTDATTSSTTTTTTTTNVDVVVTEVIQSAQEMAMTLRLRTPQRQRSHRDEITACYLDSAVPAMLDTMIQYIPSSNSTVWDAIVHNANVGGENVHRGSCLGAIWGAVAAAAMTTTTKDDTTDAVPRQLVNGLYHHQELSQEIQSFIRAISHHQENKNDKTETTE